MIAGKRYNGLEVDIWSSGVTLYAMLCGYLPFEDPDTAILYRKILKGDFEIPDFLTSKAAIFLKGLLSTDPKNRFTLEKIKKSQWYSYYQDKANQQIEVDNKQRLGLSADDKVAKILSDSHAPHPNISYDQAKAKGKANQTDINIGHPQKVIENVHASKNQTQTIVQSAPYKSAKAAASVKVTVRKGGNSASSSQEPRIIKNTKTKQLMKTRNVKPAQVSLV